MNRSVECQLNVLQVSEPQAYPKYFGEDEEAPEGPSGNVFEWNEDDLAAKNYAAMGERLAACGDLHCNPEHNEHCAERP